jgi:MATE family multidrug resistance protein
LGIIVLAHPAFKKYLDARTEQWTLRANTWKGLLRIGVPTGLQMGMEVSAFAVSAVLIGMIGAVSLAAHQIAIACASFTFLIAAGLSQGSSIRTSHALGRGDWRAVGDIGKSALLLGIFWGVFCAANFMLFRRALSSAFTRERPVAVVASTLLFLAALFQISDSLQAIGAGILRGIKDVKTPTILILIAYWLVGLPTGYLLAFHFGLGAVGMWLGFLAGLTFSALFLSTRFLIMTRRQVVKRGVAG